MYIDPIKEGLSAQNEVATREQEAFDEKAKTELPSLLRSSGLEKTGPPQDRYDYAAMYKDNASFEEAETGGYDLPNKHVKGMEVAGVDLNSGKQTDFAYEDKSGLMAAGRQMLAESHYNTKTGHPENDIYALTAIHRGAFREGAKREDIEIPGWPEDMKNSAAVAGLALTLTERDVANVMSGRVPEPLAPVDLAQGAEEPVPEEAMKIDQGWQDDTRAIMEYHGLDTTETTDEDAHKQMIAEMAAAFNSPVHMAGLITQVKTGMMPEPVAQAYVRQWQRYTQMESYSWNVVKNTLYATAADPLNVGGLAALVRLGFKKQLTNVMLQQFMKTLSGRAATTATVGAAEGGTFAGEFALLEEQLKVGAGMQDDVDFETVMNNVMTGAAAGGTIGLTLGLGGPLAVKAFNRGLENLKKGHTPPMGSPGAQRGSFSWQDDPWLTKRPPIETTYQYGASTENKTYSRLSEAVARNMGGKPIDIGGLRSDLMGEGWQSGGKGGRGPELDGYSKSELEDSGLINYLDELKAEGKRKVSKDDILDYLYVNRDRVNVEATRPTSYGEVGERNYPPIDSPDVVTGGTKDEAEGFLQQKMAIALTKRVYKPVEVGRKVDDVAPLQSWADDMRRIFDARGALAKAEAEGTPKHLRPVIPSEPKLPPVGQRYQSWVAEVLRYNRKRIAGEMVQDPGLPQPRTHITFGLVGPDNKLVSEIQYPSYDAAMKAAAKSARELVSGASLKDLVGINGQLNESTMRAPLMYQSMTLGHSNGFRAHNPNAYTEMRLFIPGNDTLTMDKIAYDRFGASMEDLTADQLARVKKMHAMRKQNAPAFHEGVHYPSEEGRFAHVRMDEYYDGTGEPVLFIEELQTDRSTDYFVEAAEAVGGKAKSPQQKFQKNWDEVALRQVILHARERGYKKIAWPGSPEQVAVIESWGEGKHVGREAITGIYTSRLPKLAKKMGTSASQSDIFAAPAKKNMVGKVYIIDVGTAKAGEKMPISGFIATPAGGMMMNQEEKEVDIDRTRPPVDMPPPEPAKPEKVIENG